MPSRLIIILICEWILKSKAEQFLTIYSQKFAVKSKQTFWKEVLGSFPGFNTSSALALICPPILVLKIFLTNHFCENIWKRNRAEHKNGNFFFFLDELIGLRSGVILVKRWSLWTGGFQCSNCVPPPSITALLGDDGFRVRWDSCKKSGPFEQVVSQSVSLYPPLTVLILILSWLVCGQECHPLRILPSSSLSSSLYLPGSSKHHAAGALLFNHPITARRRRKLNQNFTAVWRLAAHAIKPTSANCLCLLIALPSSTTSCCFMGDWCLDMLAYPGN